MIVISHLSDIGTILQGRVCVGLANGRVVRKQSLLWERSIAPQLKKYPRAGTQRGQAKFSDCERTRVLKGPHGRFRPFQVRPKDVGFPLMQNRTYQRGDPSMTSEPRNLLNSFEI